MLPHERRRPGGGGGGREGGNWATFNSLQKARYIYWLLDANLARKIAVAYRISTDGFAFFFLKLTTTQRYNPYNKLTGHEITLCTVYTDLRDLSVDFFFRWYPNILFH